MFEVETLTIEDIVNDFHVSNLEKKWLLFCLKKGFGCES
jgi:hypothetical protein